MINLKSYESLFQGHIDRLGQDLSSLRTGRASALLVEHIIVDSYGTPTPLKHLASISVPDAKTLQIAPWDKSLLKEIEKAITQNNLGINPLNDGVSIRLIMPAMTEENRKALLKIVGTKGEQAKIGIRTVRDEIREEITHQERNKEITEDDKYNLFEGVDKMTKEYTLAIESATEKKEQEIMTI